MQILTEGFLRIPPDTLAVDYQQAAADVGSLVAITNTFLSQPWKKWLYMGVPGLCQVCVCVGGGGSGAVCVSGWVEGVCNQVGIG